MKFKLAVILLLLFNCFVSYGQNPADTLNKLDAKGQKHGYWKKYNGDTLKYEGRFDHGVPVGKFVYYYADRKIKSINIYSDNGKQSYSTMYFPEGSKLSEGLFINQKREGLWKTYDGYDAVISECEYKNGQKWGLSKRYYQNGNILEVANYINGWMDGQYAQYFPDNVPKIKGTYVNTKRNGIWVFYHGNGIVYTTGKYVDGLRQGDWVTNDENGKIIVRETFKNGNVISREVFQKDKDPLELNNKDSKLDIENRGKSSTDNGIGNSIYDNY
jgi:antitoxin component YwqK of YwqJK toxin-antitoxin module